MSELSHFEIQSTVVPKKTPYAIIIGTVLAVIVLWLVNALAPTEGVKDLKSAQQKTPAASGVSSGTEDIDDI